MPIDTNLTTIKEAYNPKDNLFDLLRFVFAVMVIYSHSFVLLKGQGGSEDLLAKITNNQISAGSLAVNCFFVLSGFLIMQSLSSTPSISQYIKNRFLRIFPAFFVSLFLISFIIGPFLTVLPSSEYFKMNQGGPVDFIFKNITFNIFGYSWTVRDLFQENPYPGSANGSMWTLKHEVAMYMFLPLTAFFLLIKIRRLFLLLTVILSFLSVFNLLYNYKLFNLVGDTFWILSSNEYDNFIRLTPYFLIGSLLYLYRDRVVLHYRLVIFCLMLLLVGVKVGLFNIVLIVALPYTIITLAIKIRFSVFRKYGDFSYGMYIYAFPIQQLLAYKWGESLTVFSFFLLSTFGTLIAAILSWHIIEKRALKLKDFKFRRDHNKKNEKIPSL
ncbi:acyltransferase [Paenibacillus sp. FSL M8-0334]|uniref:acyltransferase family protein n=1 Tax=Paenibacillus sp. FSL M8-0334 TaxID=2921623 RepID=UPI0030F9D5F3